MWQRMLRILIREGSRPRVFIFFFKAVVQSVLLFDAESWVFTPQMGRALGVFQDHLERLLVKSLDVRWEYTSAEAGFEMMDTYIHRRQNTVMQYISTQLMMRLCETVERKQGVLIQRKTYMPLLW